ncbi:MAG: DUF3276 family protein [Saprospiraceae bacterium]|nr:DUF3276 family protein [Saprospiraceae bacterium]
MSSSWCRKIYKTIICIIHGILYICILFSHVKGTIVEYEDKSKFDSVYTSKVKAGKRRTYFFDVRRTKGDDYYITITESTKKFNSDGYERHKIFLYKEDFNRFMAQLNETVNHVKNDLMPDFDYDAYEKRQAEWEASQSEEDRKENEDDVSW